MLPATILLSAAFVSIATVRSSPTVPYYGSRIGKFSTYFHDVKGDVYAIDDKTIFIKNFKYDGKGQEAHFWAGTSIRPDTSGFIIPDQRGTFDVLPPSSNEDVLLRLPDDKMIQDIRWLAVWNKRYRANFGSLIFPKNLSVPSPVVIGPLEKTKHNVTSGPIIILDTQTFLVPNFTYDGKGKHVYWWLSRGLIPNTGGLRLRDENGSDSSLKEYPEQTTVVISVPGGHSVSDFETLSVWSAEDFQDYGFTRLPKDVLVPPSPRSLGIPPENKLNCEMLNDDLGFEVRWVIHGNHLIMQLISKIGFGEYMALGLSKDDAETKFTSADAAVTWIDPEGRGHAVDYFLKSTDKCEDGRGMCPDTIHEGAEDDLSLMNAARVNDYVTVTFKRPLNAVDKHLDQHIFTDGPQAILWAIGPVMENGEAGPPRLRTRGNLLLDFGREPMWNCPSSGENVTLLTSEPVVDDEPIAPVIAAKAEARINCPTDLIFRAQMGPSMDEADLPQRIWYINGLPSPVLTVQRDQTYTFLVEGGMNPPLHHPLYITSSAEGGLYKKVLGEKNHEEIIFAGVAQDPVTNGLLPTAEGRLCEWSRMIGTDTMVESHEGDSSLPLELNCEPGNAGNLQWTPGENISDAIFYQSFTEMNMGGKIRVVDWCEETDPEGYIIEAEKKPLTNANYPQLELERERDSVEDERRQQESVERDMESSEIQQHTEVADYNRSVEENINASRVGGILQERIMNLQRGGQGKIKLADFIQESPLNDEGQISVFPAEPFDLRDESERSDFGSIHGQVIIPKDDKVKKPHYRPLHLEEEETATLPKSPTKFSVQFEGGFVPLVRNPLGNKESTEFVPPPPPTHNFRGPQRPFLFDANESVPFHGTFKPGVPDFSGFNISHYTQSPLPNADHHVQVLHSIPKHHHRIIQRPLIHSASRPQENFLRPQASFLRPAAFGYPPRPLRHQPRPQHNQQHLFAQLPPKHRPGVLSSESQDLDEGSSQRVQVALQNPGNDKIQKNIIIPGYPSQHGPGMKHHSGGILPPNGGVPVPPIQRRPDIVNEDEVQFLPPKNRPSHANYNPQRIPNSSASQNDKRFTPPRPQRIPIPLQHPPNSNLRSHPNQHRFPLGANARPHPVMLQGSMGMRPEHFQDFNFQHKLSNGRPLLALPQRHSSSLGEEASKLSDEIAMDTKRFTIPSLETFPKMQQREKFQIVPSNKNSDFSLFSRATIAPDSHRFTSLNIKEDITNIYPQGSKGSANSFQDNSPLNGNDRETEENKDSLEFFTPSPPVKPYLILPPLPSPLHESHEDILLPEESQDSPIEISDSSSYNYAIDEFLDSADTNTDSKQNEESDYDFEDSSHKTEYLLLDQIQSGQSSDLSVSENIPASDIMTESQTLIPEKEDVRNDEKDESEVNIHIPDEHLGENETEMHADVKVPSSTENTRKDKFGTQPVFQEESHRLNFFPIRRQPQFSSPPSEDDLPHESSSQKDKTEKVVHSHLNFWPGRKNILPSEDSVSYPPAGDLSSKTLEEIRLPQVSQRPASHDNGTDYSILTHVLSLIGGGHPEPIEIIEPRNVT